MKVASQDLKLLVKRLGTLSGEQFLFDGTSAYSTENNIVMVARCPMDTPPFSVNAQKFSQIAGRLDGDVDISLNTAKLIITAKRSKLSLPIIADPHIPSCPDVNNFIELPLKETLAALDYASQAAIKSEMHSYSGVIQFSERYAAGSDGKRLAVTEIKGPANPLLLPVRTVQVLKCFDGETFQIADDATNIYFQIKHVTIVCRKLCKNYPDWSKIIPVNLKYKWQFNREELRDALKQIAPLIDDQRFLLTCSQSNAILSVSGREGSGEVECNFLQLLPEPDPLLDTSFSGTYRHDFILDFVESVSGDIIFSANDPNCAAMLECGSRKLVMGVQR